MKDLRKRVLVLVLLVSMALIGGGCDDILTIGDSWTVLYNAEVVKLMTNKVVTTKSQGGWTANIVKQILPGWLNNHRNAEVAFILLGGNDYIDAWTQWVNNGCPEVGDAQANYDECFEFACPVPAPGDPVAQGWIEQILLDLTEIGHQVKNVQMVPVFATYSGFPPVEDCGQEYYWCEQDRINLNAAMYEVAERFIEIAAVEGFETLDIRGLHEENCCCYMDPIHPAPPGTPGVVSGTQLVAQKWCEKYLELFGPQPGITCEFEGVPCTVANAPDCIPETSPLLMSVPEA